MKRSIGLHHRLQANTAHEPGLHPPRHLPLDPQTILAATTVAAFELLHEPLIDPHGPNQAPQAPSEAPTAAPAERTRVATVK